MDFLFWTEVRVPDGRRPDEDVEWAKETLTLLFLLLTTRRRRWLDLGLRVLCSWAAAIGLLLGALALRAG